MTKLGTDVGLLQKNINICNTLVIIAKENAEILERLQDVKIQIQSMMPSECDEIICCDKALLKLQEKLKKAMMKEIFQPYLKKTNPLLKEVELLCVARGNQRIVSSAPINMSDFVIDNGNLSAYVGSGGEVVLPLCVKVVGEKAFSDKDNVTRVVINEGCVIVKNSAFEKCDNLQEVVLPQSLATIEESAFYNCKMLTRVLQGLNIVSIGGYAFAKCPNLQVVYISETIKEIGDKAFFLDKNIEKSTVKAIKDSNKKAFK